MKLEIRVIKGIGLYNKKLALLKARRVYIGGIKMKKLSVLLFDSYPNEKNYITL